MASFGAVPYHSLFYGQLGDISIKTVGSGDALGSSADKRVAADRGN